MSPIHALLHRARRPGPLVAMSVAYLVLVSGVMIWRGISVSPDYLLLLMVPVALLSGRFFAFLRDWVPFVALFLGYEALSGVAPKLGIKPQIGSMVHIERELFAGRDPSKVLQRHFGAHHWLLIVCTVIYFCHFLFPIAVGLVLWLVDRSQFLRFTTAVLAMSFAAFIFFLLLPTAPPWYANQVGLLPGVHDLLRGTLPSAVSPYFQRLDADPVAAFPSLHAAYPTLGALALWQVSRRTALFMVPWCLAVWFSVVILGQHYVVDVAGGIILAAATWAVMMYLVVPHVAAFRPRPAVVTMADGTAAGLTGDEETGAPVHDGPVHDGPVHDSPVHDSPVHDSPVHDSPVHDSPVHDSPVHDSQPGGGQAHEGLDPAATAPEQAGGLSHRTPGSGA